MCITIMSHNIKINFLLFYCVLTSQNNSGKAKIMQKSIKLKVVLLEIKYRNIKQNKKALAITPCDLCISTTSCM